MVDVNGFGNNNPLNGMGNLTNMNEQLRRMFGPQFLQNIMKQMPMQELNALQNMPDWKQMFGGTTGGHGAGGTFEAPRIDLYETRQEVVAVIELPGLESTNGIKVNVKADSLTVSGSLEGRFANIPEDRFHLSERFRGEFERTVSLPARVRPNQARATYRNGLLEVRMTKDTRKGVSNNGHSVPISS